MPFCVLRALVVQLRSGQAFLLKLSVLVVGGDIAPVDDQALDLGARFQRVAVGDDEVGRLARLGAAQLLGPENLVRVQRDRLQGFFLRQAEGRGLRRSPPRCWQGTGGPFR